MLWSRGNADSTLRFLQTDRPVETRARLALVPRQRLSFALACGSWGSSPWRNCADLQQDERHWAGRPQGDPFERTTMSEQINVSGPMYRPSREDDLGLDTRTKRLLYLAGAGGLAIIVGIAAYSLLTRHSGATPCPFGRRIGPIRVKRRAGSSRPSGGQEAVGGDAHDDREPAGTREIKQPLRAVSKPRSSSREAVHGT